MFIKARAPLRLGLAGGGSDVSPFCDTYGGYVLNATIDRYAYATIKLTESSNIRFIAVDRSIQEVCELNHPLSLNGELMLHKAVYIHMINHFHGGQPISLELHTFCDAPIGSGLGASSTLVVAMIRAFVELLNLPFDDYMISQLAFKIERIDCKLKGGRQDQYSAAFGGFNFMEFYANERAVINSLRINNAIVCELEASLLLYYTGVSRHSAAIIEHQSLVITSGNEVALEAMQSIKNEALFMKESLMRGDFDGVVKSMQEGWGSKKRSSSAISSPHIDMLYQSAIKAGALAGKISGAGGGGFLLFYTPLEARGSVIDCLNQYGGQVSNCHFTNNGAQAWKSHE